jgi:glycosyltransferase involved in cell wall biosynthesis/ubiquinone/menaquinone biosynthesis C-methylase UbiE
MVTEAPYPRIGIIVVAYNAATTLAKTLDRIPMEFRDKIAEVIILDDASKDNTFEYGATWAERADTPKTMVIRHTKNLGYGGNQKAGYLLAIERGLDIVVMLHGDGQYAPEMLPNMVGPLVRGECEAVFGSRMMEPGAARKGGMPLYKYVGNRILTRVENQMLGTRLTEFHSGYRAYSVKALTEIPFQENTDEFDFDTQIIIQLVHAGKRIVEIPIPTFYGDEICYVNGMKYAKDVVKDVAEFKLSATGFGTATWVAHANEYSFKPGDGSSLSFMLEMLEGLPPQRILDLGCGDGRFADYLRSAGHDVTGVDEVEREGVRDRVSTFVLADIGRQIPAEVGSGYDIVVAGDVLEHVPWPLETLRQIQGVLRPGGQVLVSVPNVAHWYPRTRMMVGAFGYDRRGILDHTHLRFFTRATIRRLVRRAGFDIVQERTTGVPMGVVSSADGRRLRMMRRLDTGLVRLRPTLFGYQFILRLTPHAEEAVVVTEA